jgi:SAM-dependent methyltransferase
VRLGDDEARCSRGHVYEVRDGIPRFVRGDAYANNFALEWRRHSKTQFDSVGRRESAETFLAKTGLDASDLRERTVLDVGCGSGRFSEVATRFGARVVGLDLSTAVDVAATNLKDRAFAGVQGDALNPPFKPKSFDVVFSIGVLHHTPDCRAGIGAVARLVKPGGTLAVWVYSAEIGRSAVVSDFYRHLTTRISPRLLYRLCVLCVPIIFGAHQLPLIGRVLQGITPVSHHALPEWRILDTFDWYSPKYQSKHTFEEVEAWFLESDITPTVRLPFPVAVRGVRKPS